MYLDKIYSKLNCLEADIFMNEKKQVQKSQGSKYH